MNQYIFTIQQLKETIEWELAGIRNRIHGDHRNAPSRRLTQKERTKLETKAITLDRVLVYIQIHIDTLAALETDQDGSLHALRDYIEQKKETQNAAN